MKPVTMFGTLPAFGVYVRHARDVTPRNVELTAEQPDVRPALVANDVTELHVKGLNRRPTRGEAPVLRLSDVRGRLVETGIAIDGAGTIDDGATHLTWAADDRPDEGVLSARRKETVMRAKLTAEFVGTFWLVLGGCGSAVLAAAFPNVGIGLLGVSLAFGLTVLSGAYAFGPVSGGHFNPAVSVGLWAGGRFSADDLVPYVVAQVLGGVVGAAVLAVIATGKPGFDLVASGFAANGFGEHSPGKYGFTAALVTEVVMTFMFLLVILGATHRKAPTGFAGLAIGLVLTLIHLISIPVTNTSVNPARSTSQALFVGGWALQQLWLFWVAPIAGAVLAGAVHRTILEGEEEPDVRGR